MAAIANLQNLQSLPKTLKELEDEVNELKNLVKKMEMSAPDNGVTTGTIRARFTKISELAAKDNTIHGSVKAAGMEWGIKINTHMEGNTKYLSTFLSIKTRPVPDSWSANVFYNFKIITQNSKDKSHSSTEQHSVFNKDFPSWGMGQFMKYSDLSNSSYGYIGNDSIMLEVHFTIYPTQ